MLKLQKILTIMVILLSVGCGRMMATVKSTMVESSKYKPNFSSEGDLDNYLELVKLENNKVVTDEQGIYYHSTEGNELAITYMNISDEAVLKNLFSTSVGLLTPVYRYIDSNRGPKIEVDWSATKRRYSLFTKKLKLKLLPFSATKQYQNTFENVAMGVETDAIVRSYDVKTPAIILNKSKLKADYIIGAGLSEDFYMNFPKNSLPTETAENYNYVSDKILTSQNSINFTPVQLINESTVGSIRMLSGCQFIDIDSYKKEFAEKMSIGYLPFKVQQLDSSANTNTTQGIEDAVRKAEAKELKEAVKRFSIMRHSQGPNSVRTENICKEGFTAMKISGALKSQSLK